jgi:hypothetical protein
MIPCKCFICFAVIMLDIVHRFSYVYYMECFRNWICTCPSLIAYNLLINSLIFYSSVVIGLMNTIHVSVQRGLGLIPTPTINTKQKIKICLWILSIIFPLAFVIL